MTSFALSFLCFSLVFAQQRDSLRPAPQNPSPMVEQTRKHERISQTPQPGLKLELSGLLPKPVDVFIPQKFLQAKSFDLLIHFHGASFVVHYAASKAKRPLVAATVNLGAGSGIYGAPFADSTVFPALIDSISNAVETRLNHPATFKKIILSGFSAGYGAMRNILSTTENYARVDGALLLDGIHTGYIPDRTVLAEGGRIDTTGLISFLRLAADASQKKSRKRFLITHSEIFPGTFVSTTEATDYLLNALGLKREAVLHWGPLGMQQLSVARRHGFTVLGFAGNTAPDHIDHLHALFYFFGQLLQ